MVEQGVEASYMNSFSGVLPSHDTQRSQDFLLPNGDQTQGVPYSSMNGSQHNGAGVASYHWTTEVIGMQLPSIEAIPLQGCGFHLSFAESTSGLYLVEKDGRTQIFTERDHYIPIYFHYNPPSYNNHIRLYILFTKADESKKPVIACRQHNEMTNLPHLMQIEEAACSYVISDNHPTAVIQPRLLNPPSTQDDPSLSEHQQPIYTAKIKFLCRNSCLIRKDFTLVCQLETITGEVLARECLGLKISSCPRRDSQGSQARQHQFKTRSRRRGGSMRRIKGTSECEDMTTALSGSQEWYDELSQRMQTAKMEIINRTLANKLREILPEVYEETRTTLERDFECFNFDNMGP